MADFETCYFCGAGPDTALDSYGVVPAALSPGEDGQRSVTLCPDCREKLVAVLEPVVEAAEGADPPDGTAAGAAPDRADRSGGAAPDGPGDDAGAGGATGAGPGDGDGAAGEGRGRSVDADDGVTIARPDDSDPVADDADDADDDEDAVAMNRTSPTDDGVPTESPGPARGPSAPADASADDGEELTGGDPEAYRKVVRLLQNREFPVQRDDVVELAAGAYGLSPGEVDGALTTMAQKGLVSEEDGTIRRG